MLFVRCNVCHALLLLILDTSFRIWIGWRSIWGNLRMTTLSLTALVSFLWPNCRSVALWGLWGVGYSSCFLMRDRAKFVWPNNPPLTEGWKCLHTCSHHSGTRHAWEHAPIMGEAFLLHYLGLIHSGSYICIMYHLRRRVDPKWPSVCTWNFHSFTHTHTQMQNK